MIPTTGLGAGASFSSAGFSSVDSVAGVGCCAVSTPGIATTPRLRRMVVYNSTMFLSYARLQIRDSY